MLRVHTLFMHNICFAFYNRLLFYAATTNCAIYKVSLDASHNTKIVPGGCIAWIVGVTIDTNKRRVIWVEQGEIRSTSDMYQNSRTDAFVSLSSSDTTAHGIRALFLLITNSGLL